MFSQDLCGILRTHTGLHLSLRNVSETGKESKRQTTQTEYLSYVQGFHILKGIAYHSGVPMEVLEEDLRSDPSEGLAHS